LAHAVPGPILSRCSAAYVGRMKANRGTIVLLICGIGLVAMGIVWTLQGIGMLGGSVMSGSMIWAVIGPIVAIAGVILLVRWGRVR